MTEALLLFGWEPNVVLNMPARRFFALMREGRKQAREREAARDVASCDIASIALGDAKYYEDIRRNFFNRAIGMEGKATGRSAALDAASPDTGKLVESLTMAASRLRQ